LKFPLSRQIPFFLALIFSASSVYAQLRLTSIADGAVVPANWLHPLIEWSGPENATLTVETAKSKLVFFLSNRRAVIDDVGFPALLKEKALRFTLAAGAETNSVRVTADDRELPDHAVFRMVERFFNVQGTSLIRTYRLSDAAPVLWTEMEGSCVGCHDYGAGTALLNGRHICDRRLFFGQSGAEGTTVRQYKIGEFSFPAVRPDGKRAALPVSNRSMILTRSNVTEPFDMTYQAGLIAVYNMENESFSLLPGASDPSYVQDQPFWSPDGKRLLFVRYLPTPGTNVIEPTSVMEIDYNDGKGGVPATVLEGKPGRYDYFPRYSPDGRWISYVESDARRGYFFRPDSDIWLLDRKSGATRKLGCCVDGAMDSWHSWSSDSRWIAYSSKCDGPMTGLWLTRVREDGRAEPPVKIVSDPELKVNLPVLVPDERPMDFGGAIADLARTIFH
jgi:hypothetical protein